MDKTAETTGLPDLELIATIGFQGKIRNGLLAHPDLNHIIYGIGHTVIIKNVTNHEQYNLHGHTKDVSCIDLSKDGSFIVSGQINCMGFKAAVIIWDFETKERYGSYSIHNVKVESVAFSCNNDYVISLGGQDCRSIIIWCVKSKEPLCSSPSALTIGSYPTTVKCGNVNNFICVTGGRETLRLWRIDVAARKLYPTTVSVGQLKREVLCIEFNPTDEYIYCGTTSGDILKISSNIHGNDRAVCAPTLMCVLARKTSAAMGRVSLYGLGVCAILALKTGELIIGSGEGLVCRCKEAEFGVKSQVLEKSVPATSKSVVVKKRTLLVESVQTKLDGGIMMMTKRGDGHQFFVGTTECEIYRVSLIDFKCNLLFTCHGAPINDIAFPDKCAVLFATCSTKDVCVWNANIPCELLRITVPNMICNSVCFSKDGRCILSGWNDGVIRAHTPETGQLIYCILDAHQKGVTALTGTSNSEQIISGGGEGEVRIWNVRPSMQILHATLKEHKGAITAVKLKSNDLECVTSGADGSCIIWDLQRLIRLQVVFANTLFQSVCYGPNECQIITCGSDRKIGYWEVLDGTQIRELEGSQSGTINALDISEDCKVFVSGGCDKLLKVWTYDDGDVTHVGQGHSDEITAVRISPGKKIILSASKDGAIFIWKFPS